MTMNVTIFFAAIVSALLLFLWAENQVAPSFQSCINQNSTKQGAESSNDYGKIVAVFVKAQSVCSLRLIDRHNGFFAAIAAAIVAAFTFTLWRSTLKLWKAGEKQMESNERIAAVQRHSSEKIGEAQVRAYVNIKSASIDFLLDDVFPRIMFIASNSGQSPARNFIWNVTLQYPGIPANRERALNEKWLEQVGMDIPAASDAPPDGALIPDMSVKQYIEGVAPGTLRTVMRAKIDFRFTDVFDKDWFGESFFAGAVGRRQVSQEDLQRGVSQWVGQISPFARPGDWDEIRKAENA